ncbi:MAG: GIY-YIG nuclease family protein [Xanthobacteraceae bacterium]
MWYVYIIRSRSAPHQEYTGATSDLKQRLADHNAGKSTHTAKFKPWELAWYCAFPDKHQALDFEKYLKSHSGRAFAKKRLLCFSSFALAQQQASQETPHDN